MNSNRKDFSIKGLVASLLIHLSFVAGYILYAHDEPQKTANKEKVIKINIHNYELPKQNTIKPTPKPIEKVKPKKKPIKKKKEIVKPKKKIIKKKKEIVKPKVEKEDIVEKQVEEVTKQEVKTEVPQPQVTKNPIKTKDTIEMQQQAFIQTDFAIIRNMVLSNLTYPNIARKMGWQGVVNIRLVVDVSGKLTSYKITKSSGKKRLDQAALDAVESIKHKTLPKPKVKTSIVLPISFNLK